VGNRFKPAPTDWGFTLIEITFAIVILAGSLVVLLGLQSASTQATIRDVRKQEAMLAARTLMSAFEISDEELEEQETTAPVAELLQQHMPGEGFTVEPASGSGRPAFDGLTGTLTVKFWPLPGLDPEVIKRINLKVAWSDSPTDKVEVIYFLPTGESTAIEEYDDE
jgi:type II secretory pathway pseudopilin PulG